MSRKKEIDEAVKLFNKQNIKNLVLLQCTTNYPTHHSEANVLAMKSFRDNYNTLVGFSDHTQDDVSSIAAVALGAVVIEKHFTLSKNLKDQTIHVHTRQKISKIL